MTWRIGQELQGGKYVIEQILGQGGFGITYKALQVNLNRPVVIKTPNEYLKHDPEYDKYIERFIAEGQILARLSQDPHPHIVGVIELFQEGNTHCLVMEFVPGENLFQAVRRRGALPEAEVVTCIRQIGEALIVVHQAGLVHRDANPGNIMLRTNGRAVLIDFGIAKQIIPATQSSTDKAANGGFAPYEQRHKGSRDPTVDVYCLAASLYYGVTGKKPTNSLARIIDNERLIPPQELISSISKELNQAILKGMALEAKYRPQSMQAWLQMLSYKPQVPRGASTFGRNIILALQKPYYMVHLKKAIRQKWMLLVPSFVATSPPVKERGFINLQFFAMTALANVRLHTSRVALYLILIPKKVYRKEVVPPKSKPDKKVAIHKPITISWGSLIKVKIKTFITQIVPSLQRETMTNFVMIICFLVSSSGLLYLYLFKNNLIGNTIVENRVDQNIRLEVKLNQRRVYVYQGDILQANYPVAIGKKGWETPTGNFYVTHKETHPIWRHPIIGTIHIGDSNPLKDRWIGFWSDGRNEIGFYGTDQREKIGKAVSHGCLIMFSSDVRRLYAVVKIGSPVRVTD